MTKKSRYFLIGGQGEVEEIEEPEMDIQDNDQLIDMTDDVPEDDIDRVLSYIRSENIDPNMDAGIRQFGKREYIKKVLDLIENPVQPVFPGMTGRGKIKDKDVVKLETSINDVIDKFIDKTKSKYTMSGEKDALIAIVKNYILKNDEYSVDGIKKAFEEEYNLKKIKIGIYEEVFTEFINSLKKVETIDKETGEMVKVKGAFYKSVIKKLNDRRENIKEVLEKVDVTGLKEGVSFPNILTLCNYKNILEMSDKGFKDRQEFVSARRDKLDINVWTPELEGSLRAENGLSEILFRKVYVLDHKYDNVFQLVSKEEAFEDVDIKIPGKGYIELKGSQAGNIKFNKFLYMARYYKEHGNSLFYGMGRSLDTKYDNYRVDVIPNKLLELMTSGSNLEKFERMNQDMYKGFYDDDDNYIKNSDATREKAKEYQKGFVEMIGKLLGYQYEKADKEYIKFKLPIGSAEGNFLIIDSTKTPDQIKAEFEDRKNKKITPKNIAIINDYFNSLYSTTAEPKVDLKLTKVKAKFATTVELPEITDTTMLSSAVKNTAENILNKNQATLSPAEKKWKKEFLDKGLLYLYSTGRSSEANYINGVKPATAKPSQLFGVLFK